METCLFLYLFPISHFLFLYLLIFLLSYALNLPTTTLAFKISWPANGSWSWFRAQKKKVKSKKLCSGPLFLIRMREPKAIDTHSETGSRPRKTRYDRWRAS